MPNPGKRINPAEPICLPETSLNFQPYPTRSPFPLKIYPVV